MIIDKEVVSLADIDEAIAHLSEMMKDRYRNRLTHQRKAFLTVSYTHLTLPTNREV